MSMHADTLTPLPVRIKKESFFKSPEADHEWLRSWISSLEGRNQRTYEHLYVDTSLGKTHVLGLHTSQAERETLVIFPGARTTALFWDFNAGLDQLGEKFRIFLVETNGLPNLSDGRTPDIKGEGYGAWASEILRALGIRKAFIAGASFGGLICMKLCITDPSRVKAAFLLNPGCLQPFSLSFRNLYYNLLPIVFPKPLNVSTFLDKAVFCKPEHILAPEDEKLLIDYEVFALTRYRDNTQKPYYMGSELKKVSTPTYLLLGDRDLLFPYRKSIRNARQHLSSLREIQIFPRVGHGIETYAPAMRFIGEKMRKLGELQAAD
jgi:pimeloyl-ACP methyl ester carboxylesterase